MSKHEYKVGDQVVVIAGLYLQGCPVGTVGTVTEDFGNACHIKANGGDGLDWYFPYDGLTPYEKKTTSIMPPEKGVEDIFSSLQDAVGMADPESGPIRYDNVSKPAHYNHGGIECIDYIRQVLGKEGFVAYCRGNLVKYNHRAMYKGNPVEDLEKAEQYLKWANETLKEIHK